MKGIRRISKKRTRRRMRGRGQTASFIRKNVNRSDALAVATAALRPLSNYFTTPDMKEFLLMEQQLANDSTGDPTDPAYAHLIARGQQLLEKYSAENRERNMKAQAARIAAMGPVERAGLTGQVPAMSASSPALAAPPSAPVAAISPRRSAGGRRSRRRRKTEYTF